MEFNKNLEKVAKFIKENQNFIIFTHLFPDGDGIGSLIAFYKLLINLGKEAYMVCKSELPYQYEFLHHSKEILKDTLEIPEKNKYNLIFLDCSDINRANFVENDLKDINNFIINIDHHLSNTNFGNINLVDCKKSATAEIIFNLFYKYFKEHIDDVIAESIYTGILTDTGKFQYSNTTKEVHKIISILLNYGINPSYIYSSIYENEPFNRLKLLELVLKRVKLVKNDILIYSFILKNDFEKFNLPFSSNDGIIELLRTVRNVKVAALLKEIKDNEYKISLRAANNGVNVAEIANYFGGGGHKMAAAFSQKDSLDNIINNLIKVIEKKY